MAKLIKIVKSVFGHRVNNVVVPKDKNSAPFEVSDATAQKLIKSGVAVLANNLKSQADKPIKYSESLAPKKNVVDKTKIETTEEKTAADGDKKEADTEKKQIAYNSKTTKADLFKLAQELGYEGSEEETTKDKLIEFLDNTVTTSSEDTPNILNDDGVVG